MGCNEKSKRLSITLKQLVDWMYDKSNNTILDMPKAKYCQSIHSDIEKSLLKRITNIIINSDVLNVATKEYLKGEGTYRMLAEKYGMNVNTFKAKVFYSLGVFSEYISNDELAKLMYKEKDDIIDIDAMIKNVDSLDTRARKKKKHVSNPLCIGLSKPEEFNDISDEDFDKLLRVIEPYTSFGICKSKGELSDDMLGCFWRLLDGTGLNNEDIERRKRLIEKIDM